MHPPQGSTTPHTFAVESALYPWPAVSNVMFSLGSSLPASSEEAGKRQLTAVELRLREVRGPAQGHTASESQGWNPGSPLLARALWTLEQWRTALMGASLSLCREGVGGGGPTGPWEGEANWGHISSPLEMSPWQCEQEG